MSTRTLMIPARVAIAQRAHKCKANQKHLISLICAELAGDFHLGYARQLTDKSSLLFDLAF